MWQKHSSAKGIIGMQSFLFSCEYPDEKGAEGK